MLVHPGKKSTNLHSADILMQASPFGAFGLHSPILSQEKMKQMQFDDSGKMGSAAPHSPSGLVTPTKQQSRPLQGINFSSGSSSSRPIIFQKLQIIDYERRPSFRIYTMVVLLVYIVSATTTHKKVQAKRDSVA
jgi:hypothetical protein